MQKFYDDLKKILQEKYPEIEIQLEQTKDTKFGDISMPCFSMAKKFRKSPAVIANEIKANIGNVNFVEKTEVVGGYLNFFLNKQIFIEETLKEVEKNDRTYGSSMSGKGKKALVEHTSINPNASPHVGRARNAMIGDVIVRLLKFEGYDVTTHYFVNDIGKQIAMLLLGLGDNIDVDFKDLLNVYVDINNKVKENPELEGEVFKLLYKLENGDSEVREKFRKVVNTCVKGQTDILYELGIKYDKFTFESDYIWSNRVYEILEKFKATGKLEEAEDGRLVLNQEEYNLPMKAPYLVLTRKDKTSLYPLRDIAYTIDKVSTNSEVNIVVLGEDQKLYFKQIAAALDVLGYKAPKPVHYSFVLLSDGKMATRKGNVVLLEDFMKEALNKAIGKMEGRYDKFDTNTAKAIAYGAVKYAFLKIDNDRNVTFDWDSALSFEGDSAPYLQYCLARINSIIKKYGDKLPESGDYSLLSEPSEFELVKEISNMNSVVKRAITETSPNIIANYAYSIAKKFSSFYHECQVINSGSEELTKARLLLIHSAKICLKNCFYILGIDEVEFM